MTAALEQFEAYQPSPVRWVDRIPQHWRARRIKTFLKEVDKRSGTGEGTLLTMRRASGLVPLADFSAKVAEPEQLRHYKLASERQIVMNPMQAGNGMFALCRTPGLISPDYRAFELIDEADERYLIALFKCEPMRATFRAESKGLGTGTAGFLRLYPERFGSLFAPFPSLAEQRQIADFLDAYTAQIHRLIAAKRRVIALLNDRKQAILADLLRSGLDGQAIVSGDLPWIDRRPCDWRVNRLKPFVTNVTALETTGEPSKSIITLDRVESWSGRVLDGPSPMIETFTGKAFEPDDVLFGKLRPYLAKVTRTRSAGLAGTEFLVLRADPSVFTPTFLELLLRSKPFIDYVASHSVGAKMPRTEWEAIAAVPVAIPALVQQERVCAQFAEASREFDRAIDRERSQIELIQEYRDTVVAAVVTGQLDVRDAPLSLLASEDVVAGHSEDEELEELEDALNADD